MASLLINSAVLQAAIHHATINRLMDELNAITPRTDNVGRIGLLAMEIRDLNDAYSKALDEVIIQAEAQRCALEDARAEAALRVPSRPTLQTVRA